MFGMSDRAFGLKEGEALPFLSTLKHANGTSIFRSFSYTACAWLHRGRTPDTLLGLGSPSSILGGYDRNMVAGDTSLEVDLRRSYGVSNPRQLAVNLSSIYISSDRDCNVPDEWHTAGDSPLSLEPGMTVNIDSTTAHMWLPQSACDTFERKLQLQWDERAQMYSINSTSRERLLQQNYSIEFQFSSCRVLRSPRPER